MSGDVLGWDIGGANLKVARVVDGAVVAAVEEPFALWREPGRLPEALGRLAARVGGGGSAMAVTMTAELADCFATKREGVAFVLDALRTAFPDCEPRIYGVDGRFHSPDAARCAPLRVAAANWAAAAAFVARQHRDALLIDVGSTTTDIIPLVSGRIAARGRTDPARLMSGELVYTGVLRSPVMSIVRRVPLRGRWCRVAAEHFAIAADVHCWLRRIPPGAYRCETPDGRGVSRREAAARIARVVCADLEMLSPRDITRIARHVARAQRARIVAAIRQVLSRLGAEAPRVALAAGAGAFLARDAARAAGLRALDLGATLEPAAARALPAAAVAWLLAEEERR
ncbi:MAG TPA: hydantoinase/oxoprolinase family protein [Longimicrobiales bacterium]